MDSSFYAPGGGGASALTGLTDTDITTPILGDALIYDGAAWINGDALNVENATIKDPQAARWYFSRNQTVFGGLGGYGSNAVPIRFANRVTINKFVVGMSYNPPSTQGNGGVKIRAFIYNTNDQGNPNSLHADLGYFTIQPSDSGGAQNGPFQFTLASPVTLQAGQTHYIGFAYGPINPAAGNLGSWTVEAGGLTEPFFNLGLSDNLVQYMTSVAGLYVGGVDWSTFNYETGNLPSNISNNFGYSSNVPRMGLRVNAVG